MLTQTIHVMLSDPGLVKKIEVVQGDTGREIECIVDDMQIPEGATAIICGVKPSMKGFRNSCTVSGQKITAEITNQMDAEEGWTPFQILIQDAGSTVSTFTIVLDVKKSYSGDFPVSENESTWLEEYVEGITDQVNTATENAETATQNADTAAENANSAADAANAAAEAVKEAVSGVINDKQVSESTTYSSQKLGNFSQLLTTAKNTFVAAINELVLKIGDLKQLATTEKTDIVSAINEIEGGKLNKANVANNLTTTQEGYALDARQGKTLDDKVTQLNSALSATVLYSGGGRPLNYTEPWNETLNFSSFQKIEMTLRFQAQDILIPLSTYGGDESIKSFGFNTYNDNDGQQRVISGYLQFAGRYITNVNVRMRLNDQITQVDASNIIVTRIVGYKNA